MNTAILNRCLMFHVSVCTFIYLLNFSCSFRKRFLLEPMENIYSTIVHVQRQGKKTLTKYERLQFKVSNSVSFQMRSCSEIDINIIFISNTKCIHPIGHSVNVSFREASRIDIKCSVLHEFCANICWPR